MLIVFIVVL